MALTDNSILQVGKAYKGKALKDVPDDYLLWLYNEGIATGELAKYIKDNLDVINKNLNSKSRK